MSATECWGGRRHPDVASLIQAALAGWVDRTLCAQIEGGVEIEASDMAEAIRIASEGRQEGRWDLFRGQSNSDWEITSSAERLSEPGRLDAVNRVKRFVGWAQGVEGMSEYLSDLDSMFAIAQHYGLPTFFIDFSDDPRIAAFFASDTRATPPDGQTACIYCVNIKEFTHFWDECGPTLFDGVDRTRYPSFLKINVTNLWRLQQQKGSFLWNPLPRIERFYDFDRIVFPYANNHPALP